MEQCMKCVYANHDCSPEAMHIAENGEACKDFRPFVVNCSRCHEEVVHGARRTLICLDCLVELLEESGSIETMRKDYVRKNDKA